MKPPAIGPAEIVMPPAVVVAHTTGPALCAVGDVLEISCGLALPSSDVYSALVSGNSNIVGTSGSVRVSSVSNCSGRSGAVVVSTTSSSRTSKSAETIPMLVGSSSSISSGSSVSVPPESIRPAEGLVEIRRGYGASLDDRHFVSGGSITAILNFKEFARVCVQERFSMFSTLGDCLKKRPSDVILDFLFLLDAHDISEIVSDNIQQMKDSLEKQTNNNMPILKLATCKYFLY